MQKWLFRKSLKFIESYIPSFLPISAMLERKEYWLLIQFKLENSKTIDWYDLNQHHFVLNVMLSMLWSQIKINSIQLNWNTLGSSLFQQIVFFWFPLRVLALYLEWERNKRSKTSSSKLNHLFFFTFVLHFEFQKYQELRFGVLNLHLNT